MIWDKTMTVEGATATPAQLTDAWGRWMLDPLKTAARLASILSSVGVDGPAKYWPTARLADRMLQRARKAGEIRFEKGRWVRAEQIALGRPE